MGLVDINRQTVAEAEAGLKDKGMKAVAHAVDITDYKAYGAAIGEIAEQ